MSLSDVSVVPDNSYTRSFLYLKAFGRLPTPYGYDLFGLSTATGLINTAASFAFTAQPTHPLVYVANMYGGYRGGTNYTVNVSGGAGSNGVEDVRVQRITEANNYIYKRGTVPWGTGATDNQGVAMNALNTGWPYYGLAGSTFTNESTNGAISWYFPMMTNTNFNFADPNTNMIGNTADNSFIESCLLSIVQTQTTANASARPMQLTTYCGAGTDFTCLWLLCCPTVDYYVANPTVTA
jgi:hypothetical protein